MNETNSQNQVEIAGACNYTRPIVTEAILAVLLGLTAKAALDRFFDQIPKLNSWGMIWDKFWSRPIYGFLLLFQLTVFLFTMYRFYLGSLRHHQARSHYSRLFPLLLDMILNTILFVGFYLAALSIRSIELFYAFVVLLHILDLIWFGVALRAYPIDTASRKVVRWFLLFDVITIVSFLSLSGLLRHDSPYYFQFSALAILAIVGGVDFRVNRRFYLGESSHAG